MTSKESALIEQALAAYKEDLWLKRRLKLDEVIKRLEGELAPADGFSNKIAQPEIEAVQGLIKFLQFLASECTGESFCDDKQWGQLLNLMQISRKLNHKSVKFKDILKNRPLIEANGNEIRRFNEQARLGRFIEKLIETFELNLGKVHLMLMINTSMQPACQQHNLAEISRCRRSLDTTLRAAVNNLQICLQNKLISEAPSLSGQFETWSKKLDLFTRITRRLCCFIEDYLALKRELSHLRPLVDSLSGVESSVDERRQKNTTTMSQNPIIGDSLASCKLHFKHLLDFEQSLELQLNSTASQGRKSSVQKGATRRQTAAKTTTPKANTNKEQQQIEVRLNKLLKPTRLDEFASELYGVKLEEALVEARECRRTLNRMMSSLRLEFGRFYFVNDLELLTIIALDWRLAQDSHRYENQRLISKLFNNSIERFLLSNSNSNSSLANKSTGQVNPRDLHIIGVQNPIGERILLTSDQEPIALVKRVNIYSLEIVRILTELMRKLQRSLGTILATSLGDARSQSDFDWSLPVQLFELAERIKFTQQAELAFKEGTLKELLARYESQLKVLSSETGSCDANTSESTSSDFVGELKRSVALSLSVHFISTLLGLLKMNVSSCDDWLWLKLARYYWLGVEEDHRNQKQPVNTNCQVRVCLASSRFYYKFDLLPVESTQTTPPSIKRLIYTDTSERCFLAASQAIGKLKLGASPYGPAGSGKTETIKALGRLLGCQVIVHNCDETNDQQALERLIWGLAHTGLWGCFDEFNRLSSGTLSSVSALLELVQVSLRSARTTLELADGQMKSIDPDSAFFVTLNPGDGRKYRGRRRLPANLRSLFLSIAMVRVQIESIVREMLLVFGASTQLSGSKQIDSSLAERLGLQMASWIEWTRANMRIDRCEWDLRLVMTILRRFRAAMLTLDNAEAPNNGAQKVVTQTLVESITKEVAPRLEGHEFAMLADSVKRSFGDLDGQNSSQTDALQQLDDQLETRPGVILLGPSGSGKSRLWRSLAARKNHKDRPIVSWLQLSPKSCNRSELFGRFKSPDEAEAKTASSTSSSSGLGRWSDGLLTKLVRDSLDQLQNEACLHQVWLVLDGPLDPDWIESLNSVLDDNQVLTLSSGERLNFVITQAQNPARCIKLIFETDDISDASPATISRLGLINLTPRLLLDSTLERSESREENQLVELLVYSVEDNRVRPSAIRKRILEDLAKSSKNVNENGMQLLEFACFEGATSGTLLELLQLACSSEREKQPVLLINNLQLIQSEDQWQTRTFIELLRHVITNNSYYDSEFNLKQIPTRMQIVLTTTEDLSSRRHHARLLALASGRHTIQLEAEQTSCSVDRSMSISFEQLVNWTNWQAIDSGSELNSKVLLVQVDEHESSEDLCRTLVDTLARHDSNQVELYTFGNSTNVMKSIECLTKMARQSGEPVVLERHQGGGPVKKRPKVLVLSSLQMGLMDPVGRSQLCRALNLINLKNQSQLESIDLRCLFLIDAHKSQMARAKDANYAFWLQLATGFAGSSSILNQPLDYESKLQLLSQLNNDGSFRLGVQRFLTDKLLAEWKMMASGDLPAIEWLAQALEVYFQRNQNLNRQLFLEMFVKMTLALKRHVDTQRGLLTNGLRRLADFEEAVESLRGSRQAEEVSLAKRQQRMESLLEQSSKVIANGQARSEQLKELRLRHEQKTMELADSKRRIEAELAGVVPLIEASKREIDQCLKPEALNEIKTLRAPPKTIKDILDVLFVLLLEQPEHQAPSWQEMKAYLTRYSLRDELTIKFDFQKRLANERLLSRLEQEIAARADSFRWEQAARASSAIVPIVKWIQAAQEYGRVLTRVRPLSEGMEAVADEHRQLTRTMEELELEQVKLNEKIQADQAELVQLEEGYTKARCQLDEAKLDVERAQRIRANLSTPIERWQSKLARYARLACGGGSSRQDKHLELYRACLVCTSMATRVQDVKSLVADINQWLDITGDGSLARGPSETSLVRSFVENYLVTVVEDVDGEEEGDSTWHSEFNLEAASSRQLEQLVKLLVCKLNLHFNPGQLQHLWVEPTQSIDSLVLYLIQRQVLCSQHDDLVLMRSLSNNYDWQQAARLALESSKQKILLVEMPPQTGTGLQTLLDILDFFLFRQSNSPNEGHRVILFSRKSSDTKGDHEGTQLVEETRQLLRMLDSLSSSETFDETQELHQLEADITDHLVELHEPELGASISQLELELRTRQAEVRRLEANLMKSLLVPGEVQHRLQAKSGAAHDTLSSKNELVRLLLELNQSNESLAVKITEISNKLHDLQVKRDKFQTASKQASRFYAKHLAKLKFINCFYHISPRGFVGSFAKAGLTNAESIMATIELVMCSMRPNDRQAFEQSMLASKDARSTEPTLWTSSIDQPKLQEASRRASNLKESLLKLVADMSARTSGAGELGKSITGRHCKLAIILHDAKKSSPQLEVDELFMRQQEAIGKLTPGVECQYYKLYASTSPTTTTTGSSLANNDNNSSSLSSTTNERRSIDQLESQLERILSSSPSAPLTKLTTATVNATQTMASAANLTREVVAAPGGASGSRAPIGVGASQMIKCVCIANAHLAAPWINARLMEVLASWRSLSQGGEQEATNEAGHHPHHHGRKSEQLLVLLVAECDESTTTSATAATGRALLEANQKQLATGSSDFDLNLLEETSLRFWYDELGLEFSDRFQLYKQLISSESYSGSSEARNDDLILQQLILFHVVCQELTRDRDDSLAQVADKQLERWQRPQSYSFDYDLLQLALKVLRQIGDSWTGNEANKSSDTRANELRRGAFCNQLESIVYGARMETEGDERLLKRLIDTFLRSAQSAERKLAEFNKLSGKLMAPTNNNHQNLRELHQQQLAQLCLEPGDQNLIHLQASFFEASPLDRSSV